MFDIKYTELNFVIRFKKDCRLQINKSSALRGGIGNILILEYCIYDKKCKICPFKNECTVFRIFHPKIEIDVPFLDKSMSSAPGFAIELNDNRELISKNDIMNFNIIFFSRMIAYVPVFIKAIKKLGRYGLCSMDGVFDLIEVNNVHKLPLYYDKKIYKHNIYIDTVQNYVNNRRKTLNHIEAIQFITPFRILRNNILVKNPSFNDFIYSISRRLIILNALEGDKVEELVPDSGRFINNNFIWTDFERYSSRQNKSMKIGGVVGKTYVCDGDKYLDYIIACELCHTGKNTVFGHGKYVIL